MNDPFEPTGTTLTITPTGGSAFSMEYITITPPNRVGGDPIKTTTLSNVKYHTKMAPKLIDIGNMTFTCEMDPSKVNSAPLNQEGVLVLTIPNVGSWTFQGYLQGLTPGELQVGDRATCSGECVITNVNSSGDETDPVWSDTGTLTFQVNGMSLAELRALATELAIEDAATATATVLIGEIKAAIAALGN